MLLENEYVQRQIRVMLDFVARCRSGNISLSNFVNNIEGLCIVIEESNPEWVNNIRTQINKLEFINASNIEMKGVSCKLDKKDWDSVNAIIAEIEKLLKIKLDSDELQ